MLGCIIFVVGLIPGILAWYAADQQDWVAMLVMGGIMVLIDGFLRWQRSGMVGWRRFWHANAGGHMLFVPNWMWGTAQIGNAIYVNVI